MAGASRIWKFVKPNLPNEYEVDLLGFVYDFTQLNSFELRAVDRSVFCHLSPRPAPPTPQSLSHNFRCHGSPSRRPPRGVACPIFGVLRDEHLSIDQPVCVHFSPGLLAAAAGFFCYTAAIRLAITP